LIPTDSLNSCNHGLFDSMTLILHKSQVHCSGVMHRDGLAFHSFPLLCLQRQVAENCDRIVLLLGFIS